MPYLDHIDFKTGFADPRAAYNKGKELQAQYNANRPFPFVLINNFLPTKVATGLNSSFDPPGTTTHTRTYDRAQERLNLCHHPDALADASRSFFSALNAQPFIDLTPILSGQDYRKYSTAATYQYMRTLIGIVNLILKDV